MEWLVQLRLDILEEETGYNSTFSTFSTFGKSGAKIPHFWKK
jgi:hypothetical protein